MKALTTFLARAVCVALAGLYFMLGVGIAHAHLGSPARTIDYGNAVLIVVLFAGAFKLAFE